MSARSGDLLQDLNYAGHRNSLANVGDYVTCRVADQELFVIRSKDERLRAL
jgi:phenylpropionate dioxygenase-like ring-hydroxylating dioxygenase large terminal subunit